MAVWSPAENLSVVPTSPVTEGRRSERYTTQQKPQILYLTQKTHKHLINPPPDNRVQLRLLATQTSFSGLETLNSCWRLDGASLNKTKADYISRPTAESPHSLIKSAQTFHQCGAHRLKHKAPHTKDVYAPRSPPAEVYLRGLRLLRLIRL